MTNIRPSGLGFGQGEERDLPDRPFAGRDRTRPEIDTLEIDRARLHAIPLQTKPTKARMVKFAYFQNIQFATSAGITPGSDLNGPTPDASLQGDLERWRQTLATSGKRVASVSATNELEFLDWEWRVGPVVLDANGNETVTHYVIIRYTE